MAAIPINTESRLSFAKVVASSGKENNAPSFARIVATGPMPKHPMAKASSRENPPASSRQGTSAKKSGLHAGSVPVSLLADEMSSQDIHEESSAQRSYDPKLIDAVKAINLSSSTPSLVVNGSESSTIDSAPLSSETSPDDLFQRTDSGSELGTKPPSLDGKSITSGTTFALDEKESLRPDDSASVKAAEDDDTFSGRGSIVAGSRIGSEAAARAYRAQTYEISDKRGMIPTLEPQGVLTPQSGSSGQQIVGDVNSKPLSEPSVGEEGFNLFYKQTPDDKLLEALDSPKDRIFLLRLEQDLISFVKNSKEPYIDLPPCNSFCRLLTHKLADYYHMTHQYDNVAGSVRIFRTPFCRLPESLTSISNPPTSGHTPPPAMPAVKIMRRGGDVGTGGSPSKATSESGSDGKDKGLSAKEKLSREEREAAYNKARERIFGNSEKAGDATPDTEDGQDISRSSSVSVKDRSGPGKRAKPGKQRRDDSENFDSRSQYTPFFPHQQQPTWTPIPQYVPMGVPQFNGAMQNTYQNTPPQSFVQPPPQFHHAIMGNGGGLLPFNQIPHSQLPQSHMVQTQMTQQYPRLNPPQYQPHSAPITAYGSPTQTPPQVSQPWSPNTFHSPYQHRGPMHVASSIPYPYGQLPSTANPADPKSQHPIPGSFNRHAFNPKTQSFVPGNNGIATQQPMSHHGSPHLPYNGFPSPPQYNTGFGYNMSRQGSNTSLPSYHASPHMAPRSIMHQGIPSTGAPHGNHLPHFGNISTLPPKPPPAV